MYIYIYIYINHQLFEIQKYVPDHLFTINTKYLKKEQINM